MKETAEREHWIRLLIGTHHRKYGEFNIARLYGNKAYPHSIYQHSKNQGEMMMKKQRFTYAILGILLLLTEILIGLYVHDNFIRPYIGDVLITILLCCLCRTVVPKGLPALPIYVFVFATLVEVAQYFEIVKLLGLENNPLLSTIIGTSFSLIDIVCYGVGCLIFWTVEIAVLNREGKL